MNWTERRGSAGGQRQRRAAGAAVGEGDAAASDDASPRRGQLLRSGISPSHFSPLNLPINRIPVGKLGRNFRILVKIFQSLGFLPNFYLKNENFDLFWLVFQ